MLYLNLVMAESGADISTNKSQQKQTRIDQLHDLRKRYSDVRPFVKDTVEQAKQDKTLDKKNRKAVQKSAFITAEKMYPEVMTDKLTGLHNRRWFEEQLRVRAAEARRQNKSLYILIMDIDHFKWINDAYGHTVGDEILKVMKEASHASREEEPIARIGGEEFAQFLNEEIGDEEIALVFERHNRIMQERSFEILKNIKPLPTASQYEILRGVTLSGGTTRYEYEMSTTPRFSEELNQTVARADLGLYEAKTTFGRNNLVLARINPDGSIEYEELHTRNLAGQAGDKEP